MELALLALVSAAASDQSNRSTILASLGPGEWTIRYRDGSNDNKICLKSGEKLVMLRHSGSNCSHLVLKEEKGTVTFQYNCSAGGYGRTTIRKESRELVQIESQGIARGQPFQFAAEARLTGKCAL